MDLEQEAEAVREEVNKVRNNLDDGTHHCLKKKFSDLCYFIESPIFARLCRIWRSLDQLGVLSKTYQLDPDDFDIDYRTGELQLFREVNNAVQEQDKKLNAEHGESGANKAEIKLLNNGTKEEMEGGPINWRTQKVTLRRGTSPSLGLHLAKNVEHNKNLNGIFVSAIEPGSIADKDGRLKPGDQVLSINERPLESSMSDEEILELLHKSNDAVELIIGKSSLPVGSREIQKEDAEEEEQMVEIIPVHLVNDGSGLGFGIVRKPGSGGVVVKTVLPGSIAEKDGRMRSGDHILQIEDRVVRDMSANEVASLLKHSGVDVRLTVGRYFRGPLGRPDASGSLMTTVFPVRDLDEILNSIGSGGMSTYRRGGDVAQVRTTKEEEVTKGVYEVELTKDTSGLGLTINGYQEPNGSTCIKVSELSKNGVAARDGRIKVGDEVVEVNGIPLKNASSVQASSLLRDTGTHVRLKLLRSVGTTNHNKDNNSSSGGNNNNISQIINTSQVKDIVGQKAMKTQDKNLHKQDSSGSDSGPELDGRISELVEFWKNIIGDDHDILIAKIIKPEKNCSLGITMDSRTWKTLGEDDDFEEEKEEEDEDDDDEVKEYFHFIRDVNPWGPVGKEGTLKSGDRVLQVDSQALINLPHNQMTSIIRGLGTHICMVCTRNKLASETSTIANNGASPNVKIQNSNRIDNFAYDFQPRSQEIQENFLNSHKELKHFNQNTTILNPNEMNKKDTSSILDIEQKASIIPYETSKSTVASKLSNEFNGNHWTSSNHNKLFIPSPNNSFMENIPPEASFEEAPLDSSISSETLMELCEGGWSSNPIFVDLMKGDQGLGFSVVAYENTLNPMENSLLVRGLMVGGVADRDGRMKPGDKIISVNDSTIVNSNLKSAISAIKNAPKGPIKIGILKPLLSQCSDVGSLSLSPLKASFELEPPPLSPPMSFSSRYLVTENKSFEKHEDSILNDQEFTTTTTTGREIGHPHNGFASNITADTAYPGSLVTLRKDSSLDSSSDESKIQGQGRPRTPGGHVASLRKAFENDAERISRQHFPQPAIRSISHSNNEPRLVDVHREGDKCLGISIIGGSTTASRSAGVIIKKVFPDSPAGRPGKLRNGDRILEVNGINCREATHQQVVDIVSSASNPIWFLVQNINVESNELRSQSQINQTSSHPEVADDLEQKYGNLKGELISLDIDLGSPRTNLGLVLTGNKNLEQMNTFVAAVQPGSAADLNGNILPGDELLEINGQTLQERSHLNTSYIIKSLKTQVIHISLLRNPENLEKMALNPKSPLLTPKLLKMPRHSVGTVALNDEKVPSDSFLTVGFDNLKKAKSAEFLAVPGSLETSSLTTSCDSINMVEKPSQQEAENLIPALSVKLSNGKESPVRPPTPKSPEEFINLDIQRGSNGLGISIIGGSDTLLGSIVINDIYANGAVDKDGRLKVGDVLVKVNNASLENVTRETAMKLLRQGPNVTSLGAKRPKEEPAEENFETFNVDLNKKPGQNLGITIIGKHHDSSICISELLKGGLAEVDGKLKPGDEIVLINKKTFSGQEAAAELLKSAPGMVRLTVKRARTKKSAALMAGVPKKLQKRQSGSEIFTTQLSRFDRGYVMFLLEDDSDKCGDNPLIVIKEITGQESICRHFKKGDRLISINNIPASSLTSEDAMRMIQNAAGSVSFEILRDKINAADRDSRSSANIERTGSHLEDPIKIVTLHREPSGYGFSIAGGRDSPLGDLPILVKNIFDGGMADRDGRLAKGDRISAVNGESLQGMSLPEAVAVLKSCEGTIVLTVISSR